MPTIDDIISVYENHFKFEVSDGNRDNYRAFLERQLQTHSEIDLEFERERGRGRGITKHLWVNLLVDKLLLFSYIIGNTPIVVDLEGNERRIGRYEGHNLKPINERANDLILLSGASKQKMTDKKLRHLYVNLTRRKYTGTLKEKMQTWTDLINEIGKDPSVIEYFGGVISYQRKSFWISYNWISYKIYKN